MGGMGMKIEEERKMKKKDENDRRMEGRKEGRKMKWKE